MLVLVLVLVLVLELVPEFVPELVPPLVPVLAPVLVSPGKSGKPEQKIKNSRLGVPGPVVSFTRV